MSAFSRSKGQRGEREVAGMIRDLLGVDASRRVRQHDGDSDILGVPGWCVEVKNCADLRLTEWWRQASEQAQDGDLPCLFYKLPRRGWRVLWPLASLITMQRADYWRDIAWAADTTPEAWAAVVREIGGSA